MMQGLHSGFSLTQKARGITREPLYLLRHLRTAKGNQYRISKIKLSISMTAVTPATESAKAFLASW
jgi:hypothetical protein